MINTFVFEFTDNYINIYNKNKMILNTIPIKSNIIVDNKIYDYLKLINIIKDIVNKYKVINNIFKTKIIILNFEEYSPSENYLRRKLFKSIMNVDAKIVNIYELFDDKHIFISGNIIYYKGKSKITLKKDNYIIVGNSINYNLIKEEIIKKYKINLLEYENSNTILYENIK